jgi:hypothetical protein
VRQADKSISKRWSVSVCILLVAEAFLRFPAFAADAVKGEDLNAEIVYRCYNQMGEFGAEGVRVCVDGELSAMKALSSYPQDAQEIVQRCTRRLQSVGWEMVKSCVDKDIATEREARKE